MSNIAELRNAVWQACTAIRNDHRDVKKYVEYTAILLFFKFYDDVFETLPADIQGLIPVEYRWRTLRSLDPRGFAGFHPQVLLRLRDFFTNKRWARKFGVIFDNLQFDIKHDEVLGKALIALDRVDFAGLSYDQKGAIYEFLIARMADAGVKGEFFTPRPIVDMIIEILKPQAGQRIWDPACGTGGFLSRAFEEMRADLGRKFREGSLEYQNGLHQLRYQCIYGNETESVSARLARMNMILRGDGHSTILEFNSLDRLTYTEPVLELRGEEENNPIPDILSDGGFDLIMANPPYGGSQAVCDVGGSFKPWVKSAKPEANFLQVMMHSLKPGGRCAVLMPEGVLFRPHEKKIRERLLKDFHLEAVIGLFKGAFEFADVKACVLVFSRPKGGQKGFKTQQVWVAETETFDDIRVIPGLIGSTAENGTARVVSLDEIQKAGLILRPGKFLKTRQTSQEPTLVPLSQVVKENKSTITISDSDGYRRISVALYGRGVSLRDSILGVDIKTKRQQVVKSGQLVVSNIWARKQAFGVVPQSLEGALASTDFTLFDVTTPEDELDRDNFELLLRYGPLGHQLDGQGSTGKARIKIDDFLDLQIPVIHGWKQREVIERVRRQEDIMRHAESLLQSVAKLDWIDDSVFDVPPGEEQCMSFGPLVEDASLMIDPSQDPDKIWLPYRLTNTEGVFPGAEKRGSEFAKGRSYKRIIPGAIAYDIRRVNVGSVGIMPDAPENALMSPYRVIFTCKAGLLDPKFALYLVKSPLFRRLVKEAQVGAVRDELFFALFTEIEIPIPAYARQLEIVKIIDDQLQAYSKVRTLHDNAHRSIRQLVWSLFGLASETVALPTSLVDHEDEE